MDRKKLFRTASYLVIFIFALNVAAGKFDWYTKIWFYDMPMHFLGGVWVGLVAVWLYDPRKITAHRSLSFVWFVVFAVLAVGISWEIFEYVFVNVIGGQQFDMLDTLSDICFDAAGGLAAALYVLKRMEDFTAIIG